MIQFRYDSLGVTALVLFFSVCFHSILYAQSEYRAFGMPSQGWPENFPQEVIQTFNDSGGRAEVLRFDQVARCLSASFSGPEEASASVWTTFRWPDAVEHLYCGRPDGWAEQDLELWVFRGENQPQEVVQTLRLSAQFPGDHIADVQSGTRVWMLVHAPGGSLSASPPLVIQGERGPASRRVKRPRADVLRPLNNWNCNQANCLVGGQQSNAGVPCNGPSCGWQPAGGCWGSTENVLFYKFTYFDNTGPTNLMVENGNCTNNSDFLQIGIYPDCSSGGGSAALLDPVDCGIPINLEVFNGTLPPGNYILAVDGSSGASCTWEFTGSLLNPLRVSGPANVSCHTDVTLNASGGVPGASYQWSGPNGFSSTQQNPTISDVGPVNTGMYTLTVNVNGCTYTRTHYVNVQNFYPPGIDISHNYSQPCGTMLQLNAANLPPNATGTPTYTWNGPGGWTASGPNATRPGGPNIGGQYSLTVAYANGCTHTQASPVVIDPALTPALQSNGPVVACGNQLCLTALNGPPGTTYTWAGPPDVRPYNGNNWTQNSGTSNTACRNSAIAGLYSVTYTLPNGCEVNDVIEIEVTPATPTEPDVQYPDPVPCGEPLCFTTTGVPAGATGLLWDGPSNWQDNVEDACRQDPVAGEYQLSYFYNGCLDYYRYSVTVQQPVVQGDTDLICGQSLQLEDVAQITDVTSRVWTGPSGSFNGAGTATGNPITDPTPQTGTYDLVVNRQGGFQCSTQVPVSTGYMPQPAITFNDNLCGSDLQLDGGIQPGEPFTGPYDTYEWQGPGNWTASGQSVLRTNFKPADAGVYTLTVTLPGCTATTTVNIGLQTLSSPFIQNDGPVCEGSTLNLTASSPHTFDQYEWRGPNSWMITTTGPNAQRPNFAVPDAGMYTLTVTRGVCTDSSFQSIAVLPIPNPPDSLNSNSPVCVGEELRLTVSNLDGATEFRWYGPDGWTDVTPQPDTRIRPNAQLGFAGEYSVTLIVNGCESGFTTHPVTIHPNPSAPTAPPLERCGPGMLTYTLDLGPPTQGDIVRVYPAQTGGTPQATISSAPYLLPVNVTQSTTLYLEAEVSATGCISPRAPIEATVHPVPTMTPTDDERCGPGILTLSASLGAVGDEIRWYEDMQPATAHFHTGGTYTTPDLLQTTTYYVTGYVTATGCESPRQPVVATIHPIPLEPTMPDTFRCGPGTITLDGVIGQHGTTLRWYVDNTTTTVLHTGPTFSPNLTDTVVYYVSSYNDVTGCEGPRVPIEVEIRPIPDLPGVTDVERCGPGAVTLSTQMGAGGTEVQWFYLASNTVPFYSGGVLDTSLNATRTFQVRTYNDTTTCASAHVPITATIHPLPGPPDFTPPSRCGSGPITFTVAMGTPPGDRIELYTLPSAPPFQVSNGPVYEFTTPSLSTDQAFWFQVINTVTGCTSETRTQVPVTIHPIPAPPTSFGQTRCSAGPVTFTAGMNPPQGDEVRLYTSATATSPIDADDVAPYTLTGNITASTTFHIGVYDSQTGCEGPRFEVEANMIQPPPAPQASNVERCGAGATVLTVTNLVVDELRLYDQLSATNPVLTLNPPVAEVPTPPVQTTQTFYLENYIRTANCPGPRSAVEVRILPVPEVPTAQPVSRCDAGPVTLTVETVPPTGLRVSLFTTTVSSVPEANRTVPPFTFMRTIDVGTDRLYFEAVNADGCRSPRMSVPVTAHPLPPDPLPSEVSICGPGSATLTVRTVISSNLEIRLYAAATGGAPVATDSQAPFTFPLQNLTADQLYFSEAYNPTTGCVSNRVPARWNILPIPGPPTAPDVDRCAGEAITFSAAMGFPAGEVIHLYEQDQGGWPLFSDRDGAPYLLPGLTQQTTVTFYLEAEDTTTGCRSNRTAVRAEIHPLPGEPTQLVDPRCGIGPMTFSLVPGQPVSTEYSLYPDATSGQVIDLTQGNPWELTVPTVRQHTTYFIEGRTAFGCRQRWPAPAVVHPIPGNPAGQTLRQCGPGTFTFSFGVSDPPAPEMRMYDRPVGGFPVDGPVGGTPFQLVTPRLQVSDTFYVDYTDPSTGCTSDRTPVYAEVLAVPPPPVVSDSSRCGPGPITLHVDYPDPAPVGVELRVYEQAGGPVVYQRQEAPWDIRIPDLDRTTTFFVESYSHVNGCSGGQVPTVQVVHPLPGVPLGTDYRRCGPGNVTVTVQMGLPAGQRFEVFTQSVATMPVSVHPGPSYVQTFQQVQTDTSFWVRAVDTLTGCIGPARELGIEILPVPGPPTVRDQVQCGPGQVTLPVAMGNPPGIRVLAHDDSTGGSLLFSDASAPWAVQLPVARDTTIHISSEHANGCASPRVPVQVTVHPVPEGPRIPDTLRCGPGPAVFVDSLAGIPPGTETVMYATASAQQPLQTGRIQPSRFLVDRVEQTRDFFFTRRNLQTGCESPRTPARVIIQPVPGAPEIQVPVVCGGGEIALTALMGTPAGTRIRMYSSATSSHVLASTNSDPYLLTTPLLDSTRTFSFTSVDGFTGCESPRTIQEIVVHPVPPPVDVEDQVRCGPGPLTFTFHMQQPGRTQLEVRRDTEMGPIILYTTARSGLEQPYPFHAQTTTYYARLHDPITGCYGPVKRFFGVNHVIPAEPVPHHTRRCGPGPVTMTVAMGDPAGNRIRVYEHAATPLVQQEVPGIPYLVRFAYLPNHTTYYLTSYNQATGCESNRVPAPIAVHPLPGPPNVLHARRCGPGPVEIEAEMGQPAGTEIRLLNTDSVLVIDDRAPFRLRTPFVGQDTTFRLQAYDLQTGCLGPATPVEVQIDPLPAPPQVPDLSRCGGGIVTFTAEVPPVVGGVKVYSGLGQPIRSLSSPPFAYEVYLMQGAVSYRFTSWDPATQCESAPVTAQAMVHSRPAPPAVDTAWFCQPDVLTFQAEQQDSLTEGVQMFGDLHVNIPLATSERGPLHLLETPNPVVRSTTYYFEAYNTVTGCRSTRVAAPAEQMTPLSKPRVRDVARCGPGSDTLQLLNLPARAEAVTLLDDQGNIIRTMNPAEAELPLPTVSTTTTFRVRYDHRQLDCSSPLAEVEFRIHPEIPVPQVADIHRCGPGPVTFTANVPVQAYYSLNDAMPAAVGSTSPPYTLSLNDLNDSRTLYFEPQEDGFCPKTRIRVRAEISPLPPMPEPVRRVRCGSGSFSYEIQPGDTAAAGVIRIYDHPQWGMKLTEVYQQPYRIRTTVLASTQTFYAEFTDAQTGCVSARSPIELIIHPLPPQPVVQDTHRCGSGSMQVEVQSVAPGLISLYADSTRSRVLDVSSSRPALLETDFLVVGQHRLYTDLMDPETGCRSPLQPLDIEVLDNPAAPEADDLQVCTPGPDVFQAEVQPGCHYLEVWRGDRLYRRLQPQTTRPDDRVPIPVQVESEDEHTYTLICRDALERCASEPEQLRVSLQQVPAPEIDDVRVCSAQEVELTLEARVPVLAPLRVDWHQSVVNPPVHTTTAPPHHYTVRALPASSATYHLRSVDTTTQCSSEVVPVQVAVPNPKGGVSPREIVRCGPGPVTFTFNPGAFDQIRILDSDRTTLLRTLNGPTSWTYTIPYVDTPRVVYALALDTETGCVEGPVALYAATSPRPTAPAVSGPRQLCSGQTMTLRTLGPSDLAYHWEGPEGRTHVGPTWTINPATTSASGRYSVRAVDSLGCGSLHEMEHTVRVDPTPPLPDPAFYHEYQEQIPLCAGHELNLMVENYPDFPRLTQFEWRGPEDFYSFPHPYPAIDRVDTRHSGPYQVRAIYGACTSDWNTVDVTVYPRPRVPAIRHNAPLCAGSTDSLELSVNPVFGAVRYHWAGPSGFFPEGLNHRREATPEHAGTYRLVAESADGCLSDTAKAQIEIIQPRFQLQVQYQNPCAGSPLSVIFPDRPGVNYLISTPDGLDTTLTGTSFVRDPLIPAYAGRYHYRGVAGGCTSEAVYFDVVIKPRPVRPAIMGRRTYCEGDELRLEAASSGHAGATFRWTLPDNHRLNAPTIQLSNITPQRQGMYEVVAIHEGCTSEASVEQITVVPRPAVPIIEGGGVFCTEDSLHLRVRNPHMDVQYLWHSPGGRITRGVDLAHTGLTPDHAGTYMLYAVAQGCTSHAAETFVQVRPRPAPPNILTADQQRCVGDAVQLQVEQRLNHDIHWTGPHGFVDQGRTIQMSPLQLQQSGTYQAVAVHQGCTSSVASVRVDVHPMPTAQLDAGGTYCTGQTIVLRANEVPGATYLWQYPTTPVFDNQQYIQSIQDAVPGHSGIYRMAVVQHGCTSLWVEQYVHVQSGPEAPLLMPVQPACEGQSRSLSGRVQGGSGTLYWNGPHGFQAVGTQLDFPSIRREQAGIYEAYVVAKGCTSQVSTVRVDVETRPEPPVIAGPTSLCAGELLRLAVTQAQTGVAWHWSGPEGYTAQGPQMLINGLRPAQTGTYRVVAANPACTSHVAEHYVEVQNRPSAPVVSGTPRVCRGDTLRLEVLPISGTTYRWTGPNGFQAQGSSVVMPDAAGAASGNYHVTAQTAGGCVSEAGRYAVQVTETPVLQAVSNNSPVCSGSTLTLMAFYSGNGQVYWNGPGQFSATTQQPQLAALGPQQSGLYEAFVISGSCTSRTLQTEVVVRPTPAQPQVTPSVEVCQDAALALSAHIHAGARPYWTGPNGYSSPYPPSFANIGLDQQGMYAVAAVMQGCTSQVAETQVRVQPRPEKPLIQHNRPLCAGQTPLQLTTPEVPGASYRWSGPGGWQSTNRVNQLASGQYQPGTYSLQTAVLGCVSELAVAEISLIESPVVQQQEQVAACEGNEVLLPGQHHMGAAIRWTGPEGFVAYTQEPILPALSPAQVGRYTQTLTLSGCTFEATTVDVQLNEDSSCLPDCPAPARPTLLKISSTALLVNWTRVIDSRPACYEISWGRVGGNMDFWQTMLVPHTARSIQLTSLDPELTYGVRVRTLCDNCTSPAAKPSAWSEEATLPAGRFDGLASEQEPGRDPFRCYPNPTQGQLQLAYTTDRPDQRLVVQVVDATGRTVLEAVWQLDTVGRHARMLDLSRLPDGGYVLKLKGTTQEQHMRIWKY